MVFVSQNLQKENGKTEGVQLSDRMSVRLTVPPIY